MKYVVSSTVVTTDPWGHMEVHVTPVMDELLKFVELVTTRRVKSPPPPRTVRAKAPKALHERHGRQEMARIPCYRGVRTR